MASPRDTAQHGFALLIVLWALVLLTLLFTQLTSVGRSEASIAANLRTDAVTQALTDGAVYQGLYHLLASTSDHWNADGAVHEWRLGNGSARVVISDEAGRINPNSASPELLRALLQVLGADAVTSEKVAEAIVAWRTPDAQTAFGPDAYRRAGRGYLPPQAPYQSVDELALVLGMTPDLLARLRPHISVYPAGAVDPRVADAVVRRALQQVSQPQREQQTAASMPRNVRIAATVTRNAGSVVRLSEFRLNPPGDGPPFEVLTWESPAQPLD